MLHLIKTIFKFKKNKKKDYNYKNIKFSIKKILYKKK